MQEIDKARDICTLYYEGGDIMVCCRFKTFNDCEKTKWENPKEASDDKNENEIAK